MSTDGIQQLIAAEEAALHVITEAKKRKAVRMTEAREAAQKSNADLEKQLMESLETKGTDSKEKEYADELKKGTEMAVGMINAQYDMNQAPVVDLLVHHVTSVKLDVSDALRQSILAADAVKRASKKS